MTYVTSDWHGYPSKNITELFKKAGFGDGDRCIVLGDVIDRGADGIRLLQWIMKEKNIEMIPGNHETLMTAAGFYFDIKRDKNRGFTQKESEIISLWNSNGNKPTLEALEKAGVEKTQEILSFLRTLPLYKTVRVNGRKYLLTHSGLGGFNENRPLDDYLKTDLLWNRPSVNDRYSDRFFTVFGHTPTDYFGEKYKDRMIVTDTWADIDTGAGRGGAPMLLRLDDMRPFYI